MAARTRTGGCRGFLTRLPRCAPPTHAAQAFGLPLLQPYLQSRGKDLCRGVNFTVGGATAMDPPFFQEIGASDKLWTNLSLSVQLGWFEQLKPSLCSSPKSPFLRIACLPILKSNFAFRIFKCCPRFKCSADCNVFFLL